MEKVFTVFVEDVPKFNLPLSNSLTIGRLKQFFQKDYDKYSIKMFINPDIELKVFNTSDYDLMTLESVWDKIEKPTIFLNFRKIGKIRIGQQARAKAYPVYEDFEIIAAWSRGKAPWKNLSPFFIGPVEFETENDKDSSQIFENFWQSFKTWEKVDKQNLKNWKWPEEIHVDQEGNPNEKWFRWHNTLLHHDLPVRRPNGRNIPLYAYWFNEETKQYEKLDTVEARRKIYIPYLKKLYRSNPVYLQLLEKVKSGKNIMIVEPDGPLLDAYPQGREMNLDLLYSLIDKMNYTEEGYPHRYAPYGHGYVLATCLLEDSQ